MAYYQKFTAATTANQFLIDLAAFVAANGWTIDFDGVYNTSYRRLHFHQGAAHFDLYSNSTVGLELYGCTGYNGGLAPNLQPGVNGTGKSYAVVAGAAYWMISVKGGIYICMLALTTNVWTGWCSFFIIEDKVGSWLDGFGLAASSYSYGPPFANDWYGNPQYGQLYINGVWSPAAYADGVVGNVVASSLSTKMPNHYNGGLVPMPILLMKCPAVDSTKRLPLGYVPGVYQTNAGDIYTVGNELVIGSDTYLITPASSYFSKVGTVNQVDFLFKLGA